MPLCSFETCRAILNRSSFETCRAILISAIFRSFRNKGDFTRWKGSRVEQFIFDTLNAYKIERILPNGESGINVKWPERKGKELADIIVYNENVIFIIEAKYWYLIDEIEFSSNLNKFRERIIWLKNNLNKLGFENNEYLIVPIFYCPFPPYLEVDIEDIIIVQTVFDLMTTMSIDYNVEHYTLDKVYLNINFQDFNFNNNILNSPIKTILNEFVEKNYDKIKIPSGKYLIVDNGKIYSNKLNRPDPEIVVYKFTETLNYIIPIDIPDELLEKVKELKLKKGDFVVFLALEFPSHSIKLMT